MWKLTKYTHLYNCTCYSFISYCLCAVLCRVPCWVWKNLSIPSARSVKRSVPDIECRRLCSTLPFVYFFFFIINVMPRESRKRSEKKMTTNENSCIWSQSVNSVPTDSTWIVRINSFVTFSYPIHFNPINRTSAAHSKYIEYREKSFYRTIFYVIESVLDETKGIQIFKCLLCLMCLCNVSNSHRIVLHTFCLVLAICSCRFGVFDRWYVDDWEEEEKKFNLK